MKFNIKQALAMLLAVAMLLCNSNIIIAQDGGDAEAAAATVVELQEAEPTELVLGEPEGEPLAVEVITDDESGEEDVIVTEAVADDEPSEEPVEEATAIAEESVAVTEPSEEPAEEEPAEEPAEEVQPADAATLDVTTVSMETGDTYIISYPGGSKNNKVTSSNPSVVSVNKGSSSATVTAVKAGNATVTYSYQTGSGWNKKTYTETYYVTVSDPAPVASITLSDSSVSLKAGGEKTVTVTALVPETDTVAWTSADESVATVDGGKITAVAPGSTTVTATSSSGEKAAVSVSVFEPAIELSATSLSLVTGSSQQVSVTSLVPADDTVSWTTEDESVATVDDGTVTAVAKGSTTITATTGNGETATVQVTVTAPQPTLSVSPASAFLGYIGETVTLTATAGNAGDDAIISWSSSDPSVATVDGKGVVTAGESEGDVTITATLTYYDENDEKKTITASADVTVAFETYNLYWYALIPGKSASSHGDVDSSWFGIGVTKISGVPDPADMTIGTISNDYLIGSAVKALYPDITYNGAEFKYAAPGSEHENDKGYYTLQLFRMVVADGANAGNNKYNTTVRAGVNTYHRDYVCVLNEADVYSVNFAVQQPGTDSFSTLTSYAQRVADGTQESTLKRPSTSDVPATKTYGGLTWEFDGWYKDTACTEKANFDGTVTANITYYGKYVPSNQYYTVEYYYDGVIDSSLTAKEGPVAIGTEITSYTDKCKTGYTFSSATAGEGNPLVISTDASENVIKVYYVKRAVSYTVNYYLNGTADKVQDSVGGIGSYGETVTCELKDISGYTAVPGQADVELELKADSTQNVVNFYYYKNVTLTGDTDTYTFDGTEKTYSKGYTVSGEEAGYKADYSAVTLTRSATRAGEYDVTFPDGTVGTVDATGRYVVADTEDGKLIINKAPITIEVTVEQVSVEYDGEEHKASKVTLKTSYPSIDPYKVEHEDKSVVSTDVIGKTAVGYTAEDFTYNDPNLEATFVVTDGYLEITPAKLTVTADSDTKVYDGEALTKDTYTVEGLKGSDKVGSVTVTGSQTEVGESANVPSNAVMESGKLSNYDVTYENGTLTVTDAEMVIKVQGEKVKVTYDGEEHTATKVTLSSDSKLFDETKVSYEAKSVSAVNARTSESIGYTAEDFTYDDDNVKVTFVVEDGSLEIVPATLAVTAKDAEKVYDGTPLTCGEYTVEGLIGTDTVGSVTVTGSRTEVGSSANIPSDLVLASGDLNNYYVQYNNGLLIVTTAEITVKVTGEVVSETYDGSLHSASRVTMTSESPLFDEDLVLMTYRNVESRDVIEKTAIGYTAGDFEYTNQNVRVTFEVTDGSLEVTPAEITITVVGNNSWDTYDGKEHVVTGYVATCDSSFYEESRLALKEGKTAEARRTEKGTTYMFLDSNSFTYDDKNLSVTYKVTDGYQVIANADMIIKVVGNTDTKVYNGAEQSVTGYTLSSESTLFDENLVSFSGTDAATGTNVGTYAMGLAEKQFSYADKNVNVTFVVEDGSLEITKAPLTISASAMITKVYDGTPLTNGSWGTHGLLGDDDISSVTVTGSQTEVGESDNVPSDAIFSVGSIDNYDVTYEKGILKVTPASMTITVTGNTDTVVYNGTEQSVTGYTLSCDSGLYDAKLVKFSGTDATAKGTDVGTYAMGLAGSQFSYDNKNIVVTFVVTDGSLEVTPAPLTITAGSDTKVYDGTALTCNTYTVEGLKGTDSIASVTVTGSRTVVGTSANVPSNAVMESGKLNNYDVTYVPGSLTVTPASITITVVGENVSVTYDGAEHMAYSVEMSCDSPLFDEDDVSMDLHTVKSTDVIGKTPIGYTAIDFAYDNRNISATFKVTDGSLEITPAPLTITADSAEKVYDGEALTKDTYTVEGLKGSDKVSSVTVTGSQTEVGESANVPSDAVMESGKLSNYDVTYENGSLTVTKAEMTITVTGEDVSETYDGTEHTATAVTLSCDSDLYDESLVKYTAKEISSTDVIEKTAIGYTADDFSYADKNVTATFVVTDGSLEVKPLDVTVTITGEQVDVVYDGKTHTANTTITDDSDLYTEADYTFTGKTAVSRTEIGKSELGLAESQFTNNNANFNVTVNVTDGYVNITPASMTITVVGNTDTVVYNGKEQRVTGYTLSADSGLFDEKLVSYSGTTTAKGTDVGTYAMGLAESQFTYWDKNVDVTFVVTDGSLEITPAEITITVEGENVSVTYDGSEHTATNVTMTSDSAFFDEDKVLYEAKEISSTDVIEKTSIGYTADDFSYDDKNVTATFVVTDGSLEIKPLDVTVTITGTTGTVPYNGAEQSVEGYEVSTSSALYDTASVDFSGEAKASGTAVSTYYMGMSADQFTNTDDNFNVTFVVEDGSLTISPLAVTVTIFGNTGTFDYDGAPHRVTGYRVSGISSGLYTEDDFTFTGDATASRINPGVTNMHLTAADFTNDNDNFTVTFRVADGKVTINTVEIPDEPVPLAGGLGMNEGFSME